MLYIFLAFIALIAVFVLTLRAATAYMAKTVGKQIDEKHEAADVITTTGKAPKNWTERLEKKVSSRGSSLEIQKRAKRKILKRLDELITFFKKSPIVGAEDNEAMTLLLNELQEARDFWSEKEWKEIINP